jgi:hypothetical protein
MWDGSRLYPIGSNTQNGTNGNVYAIVALSSTSVYVAGDFSTVSSSTQNSFALNDIAVWNPTTSIWSPIGSNNNYGIYSSNGIVNDIFIANTFLYVGGEFSNCNNDYTYSVNNICMYQA